MSLISLDCFPKRQPAGTCGIAAGQANPPVN
jgi:hypothetical protein